MVWNGLGVGAVAGKEGFSLSANWLPNPQDRSNDPSGTEMIHSENCPLSFYPLILTVSNLFHFQIFQSCPAYFTSDYQTRL